MAQPLMQLMQHGVRLPTVSFGESAKEYGSQAVRR
jgi:hypothetical protein